jgi:hypothetical protein
VNGLEPSLRSDPKLVLPLANGTHAVGNHSHQRQVVQVDDLAAQSYLRLNHNACLRGDVSVCSSSTDTQACTVLLHVFACEYSADLVDRADGRCILVPAANVVLDVKVPSSCKVNADISISIRGLAVFHNR